MHVVEIETIGKALRGRMIEPDDAAALLHETGTLDFLMPSPPPAETVIGDAMVFFYPHPEDE